MTLLKDILANEVFPAIGCTEPAACAYAGALAGSALGERPDRLELRVDLATYKNGAAVSVPHCEGAKGNLIAAAAGAVLGRPQRRLEVLAEVTGEHLHQARTLIAASAAATSPAAVYGVIGGQCDFRVEVRLSSSLHQSLCVLAGGHATVQCVQRDGQTLVQADAPGRARHAAYRQTLKDLDLPALLKAALELDDDDRRFLQRGVEMNLAMIERGAEVRGAAWPLRRMHQAGVIADDLFYRVKLAVASAVDARMAGIDQAVMTSGGSGNQGLLAVLTPLLVARDRGADPARMIESLAVAHVLNAYAKCHLGELSVICGCAVAAGLAAAGAIVYQLAGPDPLKISHAIQNVIADLSGLICDGAKPGCAMKTVSGVDAALRAAFMAIEGFSVSDDDGLLGRTAEESIRNLGRVSIQGMLQVDPTLVDILAGKAAV